MILRILSIIQWFLKWHINSSDLAYCLFKNLVSSLFLNMRLIRNSCLFLTAQHYFWLMCCCFLIVLSHGFWSIITVSSKHFFSTLFNAILISFMRAVDWIHLRFVITKFPIISVIGLTPVNLMTSEGNLVFVALA